MAIIYKTEWDYLQWKKKYPNETDEMYQLNWNQTILTTLNSVAAIYPPNTNLEISVSPILKLKLIDTLIISEINDGVMVIGNIFQINIDTTLSEDELIIKEKGTDNVSIIKIKL